MAIDTLITRGQLGSKSIAFTTGVTGTDTDIALTPTTGFKFRLKGFAINAVVGTVLAGTGVSLFLCDMASADTTFAASKVIWPLAGFAANQAAGSVVRNDSNVVLIPMLSYRGQSRAYGYLSSAANNCVKISPNATLSTGNIIVSGVLFYDEELA
jgi:hypothetical protein